MKLNNVGAVIEKDVIIISLFKCIRRARTTILTQVCYMIQ